MTLTRDEILKLDGAALDAAVAESVMGWMCVWKTDNGSKVFQEPAGGYRPLPTFCPHSRIADAYEAEAALPEKLHHAYGCILQYLVDARGRFHSYGRLSREIAHASPRDRCRAMLLAVMETDHA